MTKNNKLAKGIAAALLLAGTGSVEGLVFIVFMLMGIRLVDYVQAR